MSAEIAARATTRSIDGGWPEAAFTFVERLAPAR